MQKFGLKCLVKVLAVILSFLIHGMANRAADRKDIRYALETVRAELVRNIEDIGQLHDYLLQERKSAEYLLEHRASLDKCPADSVIFHTNMIRADLAVTLSDNASDLLKSSPVSHMVDRNGLLMKIIRAYDACEWIATNQNRRTETRNARLNRSVKDHNPFLPDGSVDIARFIKSGSGLYAVSWISNQPDPSIVADIRDIEVAIDGIDEFLACKRLPVRRLKLI